MRALDADRNAFGRRREAEGIVCVERHQRIRLRIIRSATTIRKGVTDDTEVAHPSLATIFRQSNEVDAVAFVQATLLHLGPVEEHDVTLSVNAAIPVGHRLERRVVRFVIAYRAQPALI